KPRKDDEKRAYLNFYGNLMRSSDNYLVEVLDKLEEKGLYDDTLIIRTSDHGEMGMAHGGLRPTLTSLVKAPKSARRDWAGVDYSDLVLNPGGNQTAQDYVVFTYDDFQSGQASPPYPKPPNHIVSIREERWKLAKYYAVEVVVNEQ